jgi:hypothetical protein
MESKEMIALNLLPDIKQERQKAGQARRLVISGSIVVIIASVAVPVAVGIYDLSLRARIGSRNKEITASISDLKKVKDLGELLTVQSQLNNIETVDSDKIRGGNFVGLLERATPADTKVTNSFISTEENRFELSATSPTVPSAENFVDTLLALDFAEAEKDTPEGKSDSNSTKPDYIRPVANLSISSLSYDNRDKQYTYTIDGELDPALWSMQGVGFIRLNPTRLKIAKEQRNIQLLPKEATVDEQKQIDEDIKKQAEGLGITIDNGQIQTPAAGQATGEDQ